VDPKLIEYAVRIVTATRQPQEIGLKELQPYIMFGASPRASINLILTARALAFVRGRGYALPRDVLDMALDVLRHRLVLSYEALSDNVTGDDLLKQMLERIPVPVVPLHEHTNVRANA
jgi:MoxR-like ATPase